MKKTALITAAVIMVTMASTMAFANISERMEEEYFNQQIQEFRAEQNAKYLTDNQLTRLDELAANYQDSISDMVKETAKMRIELDHLANHTVDPDPAVVGALEAGLWEKTGQLTLLRKAFIFSGRGQGYAPQNNTVYGNPTQEQQIQNLKGRDFVRLGKMTMDPLSGTLVQKGDKWGLKVGNTEYDIHMGPIGYRASKGLSLKDGTEAKITGFIYGKDVSVTTMETGGSSIVLRDETGRPARDSSIFSVSRV